MASLKDTNWQEMLEKAKEFNVDDLNNIDWENTGSWPVLGKIVFCVILFVAVLVGGYFFMVQANKDAATHAQNRERVLKGDFENKAFRVANLDQYKGQLKEMEDSFGSLLKQLPRDTEVPGLIDDISAAALSAGLTLVAIDPDRIVQTEFYRELPIKIEVVGGYHEMGAFVSSVASLPRIVTLHDFSIGKGAQAGQLKMNILAKTYQYSADEGGRR